MTTDGPASDGLPRYTELPTIAKTGEHHNWGVFGDDDQIGTINLLTTNRVKAAAGLVSEGEVVDLSLPLNLPDPPLSTGRKGYKHTVDKRRTGRDDVLDGFYPQGSTQWDSLQHIRYREFGYYGGREEEDVDAGALGIEKMVEHGVVGRGVLVDFARYAQETGKDVPPDRRYGITPDDFEAVLKWESCSLKGGDVLLVRTGWLGWYLSLDTAARTAATGGRLHGEEGGLETVGLAPGADTAAWLWDNRVAAVVVDNPAVEALQVRSQDGFLHRRLIPLLGMPLGEFWDLERLSERCRHLARYEFLFVSVPLRLPGGVGSPGNGVAIL